MNSRNKTGHWANFPFFDPETTINHRNFLKVLASLQQIAATPDDTWLAQLVASTGGGKTHSATIFHGSILDKHAEEMRSDPGFLPSVYVSMRQLSDKKTHNWSDDNRLLLKALLHPKPNFRDLSEARDMVWEALDARRTEVLILDESTHFLAGCDLNDPDAIKSRANVIKSFTEDTQTRLILCGTYALTPMIRYDGQVSRRNQVVHLERYRNTPNDRSEFRAILTGLDEICRDYLQVRLADLDETIYSGCLGLIGILRNWLVRAATCAEHQGRKSITLADLTEKSLAIGERIPILEEAINGEKSLSETLADQKHLSDLFEQDRVAEVFSPPTESGGKTQGDEPSVETKKKKPKSRIGRPKPRRTPTGDHDDDPPAT